MSYIKPEDVVSPRAHWKLTAVIHDTKQDGFSVAEGYWDGRKCLGVRWNGNDSGDKGMPQSRGFPTFFIIPWALEGAIRKEIEFQKSMTEINCEISRPDGYEYGAWRVEMTIPTCILDRTDNKPIYFTLPALPNRMCHPEKDYICAVNGEMKGCFVNGKWVGDIYSNGISEDANTTSIDDVRQAFLKNAKIATE